MTPTNSTAPEAGEGAGVLPRRLGIDISECSVERVVGTMPVTSNNQAHGVLHGGASLVLAETVGGAGASAHAGPGRVAVDIKITPRITVPFGAGP